MRKYCTKIYSNRPWFSPCFLILEVRGEGRGEYRVNRMLKQLIIILGNVWKRKKPTRKGEKVKILTSFFFLVIMLSVFFVNTLILLCFVKCVFHSLTQSSSYFICLYFLRY